MANQKRDYTQRVGIMATAMDRIKVKVKEHIRLHGQIMRDQPTALKQGGKARTQWNSRARRWRDDRMVMLLAATALNYTALVDEMRKSQLFTAEELNPHLAKLERSARQMTEQLTKLAALDLPNLPPLAA